MSVEKGNCPTLSARSDIYSHYAKAGGFIYLSGQVPMDGTGKLIGGGISEHTNQCIDNIEQVLQAAGSSLEKLVKVNIFLKNMDDFNAVNAVYEKVSGASCRKRLAADVGHVIISAFRRQSQRGRASRRASVSPWSLHRSAPC